MVDRKRLEVDRGGQRDEGGKRKRIEMRVSAFIDF
jgi:hypothetical protein